MEEDKVLKLILPLPSSINHIYGRNKFGSTYLKKEGKDYKKINGEYIKQEVIKQGWEKLSEFEYCYLDEVVYMNKKGRDSDNLKKLTQDTITECEVVWFDDTYCMPRTNRIYIDKNNPRIEITLTPTGTIGIFDNKSDFECFETQCKTCTSYKDGRCSIFIESKENKINEYLEIINNNWNCNKFKISKKKVK